jgi:hypothetical protein
VSTDIEPLESLPQAQTVASCGILGVTTVDDFSAATQIKNKQ